VPRTQRGGFWIPALRGNAKRVAVRPGHGIVSPSLWAAFLSRNQIRPW